VLASYFENKDNHTVARLTQLGYVEPSLQSRRRILEICRPSPPMKGIIDLKHTYRLKNWRELRDQALDLGCGLNKAPGFIGADRLGPGVDVLLDFNHPFRSRTFVELILAHHSLEHVTDLVFTMKEIYRAVIMAPWSALSLRMISKGQPANPFYKQAFNEHTPGSDQ
jgi:hypothetical protein